SVDDVIRKLADGIERVLDLQSQERVGRKLRVPQPVMAHHTALVGVCDGSLLEILHRSERLLQLGFHLVEELLGEPDPADIEEETELLVLLDRVLLDGSVLDLLRRYSGGGSRGGGGAGKADDGSGRAEVADATGGQDGEGAAEAEGGGGGADAGYGNHGSGGALNALWERREIGFGFASVDLGCGIYTEEGLVEVGTCRRRRGGLCTC
ncbi:hypothetical protein MUK42_33261, partial [Musa troglodytarum]